MWNHAKLAMLIESIGALLIGGGLWIISPAISLIWLGMIFMVIAWSITGRTTNHGNTNSEGD